MMIENFIKYIPSRNDEFVIFDIGSRDCKQSIEFYNAFPNAKIYAFECNPNTLPICRENIKPYSDRITLIEGAVCDYDGTITFYPINQQKTITSWSDGNPGASSLFKANGTYEYEIYIQDEIQTNCHTLVTIMEKYSISRVDIIWMDLQGAELLALKGLGDHLTNVKYINTEVSYREMYTGQVMFSELNNHILSHGFIIKNKLSMHGWQEDIIYENPRNTQKNLFDIVIPVGPFDAEVIKSQIECTKKNVIGYRNIYLVSFDPNLSVDGCITIDESIFPFTIKTVASIHGENHRNGWYFQQLLKLYSGLVIPNILDRYLVIDSDTYFLKPTTFIDTSTDKCLYNYGTENFAAYFIHMNKLHEELVKVYPDKSGICHHMMFETKYLKELMDIVEKTHGETFYKIFLKLVTEITGSGASEYEIYFNYMFNFHSDRVNLRPLNWHNVGSLILNENFDYVSCHHYLR
jgi:FkbM family methyltransferase